MLRANFANGLPSSVIVCDNGATNSVRRVDRNEGAGPRGEAGVFYVFNEAYLFNKEQIEAVQGFDRIKFFERLHDELTAEGCRFRKDFHLDEYWASEGYCLYEDGEFWVVTYVDHGRRLSPAFFVHANDAEMFFRAKLNAMLLENELEEMPVPFAWQIRR